MSNYVAIPLRVGPATTHTVFVRNQIEALAKPRGGRGGDSDSDSDDSADDAERTLFVTNLPLDTTEDNIRDMCAALGEVVLDRYVYQGTRHGLISLVDEAAARRFMHKAKKLKRDKQIAWQQYGPRGAEGYLVHHFAQFPEEPDLQEKADEYMELFAQQEAQERLEAERAAEEVDADGFRTVVYKSRKRMADVAPATAADLAPRKKKRSLEKTDFYRFQLRERRKEEMSDLLKRYQQDKERVEELKQRKKYRPY